MEKTNKTWPTEILSAAMQSADRRSEPKYGHHKFQACYNVPCALRDELLRRSHIHPKASNHEGA